jgi:hypothetical protein
MNCLKNPVWPKDLSAFISFLYSPGVVAAHGSTHVGTRLPRGEVECRGGCGSAPNRGAHRGRAKAIVFWQHNVIVPKIT